MLRCRRSFLRAVPGAAAKPLDACGRTLCPAVALRDAWTGGAYLLSADVALPILEDINSASGPWHPPRQSSRTRQEASASGTLVSSTRSDAGSLSSIFPLKLNLLMKVIYDDSRTNPS